MAGILIYSYNDIQAMELVTAARLIAQDTGASVQLLTVNNDAQAELMVKRGADVYKINSSRIVLSDAAQLASILNQVVEQLGTETILLSSDRRGKELAGRLAQAANAGCLTDVGNISINEGQIECMRNSLGGATVAVQVITSERKVIAISPKSFAAAGEAGAGCVKDLVLDDVPAAGIKLAGRKERRGESVNIDAAETLVIVGQGLENKEDLASVYAIAKALGGEAACSKPMATDKKWLGEDRIVGLSGSICKPELALILGVSGQVQFTVGIRDAKTIISVNNDENAYMNQMADYFMVADLKEVLPVLNRLLA